jgi:hypothetical protein
MLHPVCRCLAFTVNYALRCARYHFDRRCGSYCHSRGGRYVDAAEYGGADTVGYDTLERICYGAKLARELYLPVAVTGGLIRENGAVPVGVLMARALENEFMTSVR